MEGDQVLKLEINKNDIDLIMLLWSVGVARAEQHFDPHVMRLILEKHPAEEGR